MFVIKVSVLLIFLLIFFFESKLRVIFKEGELFLFVVVICSGMFIFFIFILSFLVVVFIVDWIFLGFYFFSVISLFLMCFNGFCVIG